MNKLITIKCLFVFFVCIVGIDAEATKNWNIDDPNNDDVTSRLKYQYNSLIRRNSYRSPSSYSSPYITTETGADDALDGFQPNDHQQQEDKNINNETDGTQIDTSEQETESEPTDDDNADNDNGNNVRVAVQSKRRYEFVPVHYDRENQKIPRMIEIVSDTMPLRLHFKSQSAAIVVTQSHMSPPMKPIDETITMDEPFRLTHKAYKPIVQDVNEIIQPMRNIVQQVKPVIENIRTIVPQDNDIYHKHHHNRPDKREPKQSFVPEKPKTKTLSVSVPFEPNSKLINAKPPQHQQKQLVENRYFNKRSNYNLGSQKLNPKIQINNKNVQMEKEIQRRMDSSIFERRPRFYPNHPRLEIISNDRPNNYHGIDQVMRIESSEPEMIYIPSNVKLNNKIKEIEVKNPIKSERIIGDLYKDNIINKGDRIIGGFDDVGNVADSFMEYYESSTPSLMFLKEAEENFQNQPNFLDYQPVETASIFDNGNDYGDVTIDNDTNDADLLKYMNNVGNVLNHPQFHHHSHPPHLLHYHHHHHHEDDHHDHHDLFATLVR